MIPDRLPRTLRPEAGRTHDHWLRFPIWLDNKGGKPALRDWRDRQRTFARPLPHSMWDFYEQHADNELPVFHNDPYNPINFLFDNLPLHRARIG